MPKHLKNFKNIVSKFSAGEQEVNIPPPTFSDFSELAPPLRDSCFLAVFFSLYYYHLPLLVHVTQQRILKFLLEWTALFFLLLRQCERQSRGVQPCTNANSTLCLIRYWLVPLVIHLFLDCSACYWLVPWLVRLLLTCSLLVPLVTGLFRLFRVLVMLIRVMNPCTVRTYQKLIPISFQWNCENVYMTNIQYSTVFLVLKIM